MPQLTPEQKEAAATEIMKLDAEKVTDILQRKMRLAQAVSQARPAQEQAPVQYQAQPVFGGMPGALGLQPSQITPETQIGGREIATGAASALGVPSGAMPQPPPQIAPGVQEAGQTAGLAAAQSMTGVPTLAPEVPVQKEAAFTQPPAQPVQGPGARMGGGPSTKGIREAMAGQREASEAYGEGVGISAGAQKAALEKEADVLIADEQAKAKVVGESTKAWEKEIGEQADRETERQEAVDIELNKVRGAIETMKASKIDPYRFYKHPDGNTDYPKSIAAVVAVGLGALGASLPASMGGTGGPNRAMSILDNSINRDIDAQKNDIANQRAGVGLQMNLLSQMRAEMNTERGADAATRVIMLETAKMKLIETAAKSADKRIAAKRDIMVADIDAKITDQLGKIAMDQAAKELQGEGVLFGARQQQAALRAKQQSAQAKAAPQVAFPGARIKKGDYVPTKEDFTKAKPMVAAFTEVDQQISELIKWRAQYGQEKLDRAQLAIANTKLQRLKSGMRKVDETGARLDAGEIEMMGLDFSMGDLGFVTEKLNAVRGSVATKISSQIGVRGFELEGAPIAGFKYK